VRRDSTQNWTGSVQAKLKQITFNKLARSPDSKINVRSSLQKRKKSEEKVKLKTSEQYLLNNYQSNHHSDANTTHQRSTGGPMRYQDKKNQTELSYQQKILW